MLGWLSLFVGGAFGAYDIVSEDVTSPHPSLTRTSYAVQVGDDPLNRFSITNVSKRRGNRGDPAILLSPFTLPGEFYEISETGDYRRSAAGELAQAGFDVWLVDQRHTGLEPGSCESGAVDCSVLATWDFDAASTDALFALELVKAENPCKKPVIGGFSAGANTAMATVNRAPEAFAGVFLYEGTFFTEDPGIRQHNDVVCSTLEGALAAGNVYDPSLAVLGMVLRLADADPLGAFPLPIFPPGTTNQQALLYVYASPPPPGAFAPTPSFVRLLGDFSTQTLVHSNQDRLELLGPLFDYYGSLALQRDLACGLAGRDDSHYANLSTFGGDVLIFVEGTGFGPAMFDSAGLFENAASVTIDHDPDLGEADAYFHDQWERTFHKPLRRWLKRAFR
jgi:pimeloyl-ACP methyl ester carboxylesterase